MGGWQINAISIFQNGTPLEIYPVTNTLYNNGGVQRANWNGENPRMPGPTDKKLNEYFNVSDFLGSRTVYVREHHSNPWLSAHSRPRQFRHVRDQRLLHPRRYESAVSAGSLQHIQPRDTVSVRRMEFSETALPA